MEAGPAARSASGMDAGPASGMTHRTAVGGGGRWAGTADVGGGARREGVCMDAAAVRRAMARTRVGAAAGDREAGGWPSYHGGGRTWSSPRRSKMEDAAA